MNRLPLDAPGAEHHFERIEVRRSARRRKTVSARVVGGALVVSVPERASKAEEQRWVEEMARRLSQRIRRDRLNEEGELRTRALELARLYLGGVGFRDIRWVANQRFRWGSCSPQDGTIRLSVELAGFPAWVRDYVIVHELAHLIVSDHSASFWRLVNAYPLTERARGFLIAKGLEQEG